MPIIDTADEATAKEIFARSGLTASKIVNLSPATDADAIRHINRTIQPSVAARTELQATGWAQDIGFPPTDAQIAAGEPEWDAEQRAEYLKNLVGTLREWQIEMGVALVRSGGRDNQAMPITDDKLLFAERQTKEIAGVLKTEIERLGARIRSGGDDPTPDVAAAESAARGVSTSAAQVVTWI